MPVLSAIKDRCRNCVLSAWYLGCAFSCTTTLPIMLDSKVNAQNSVENSLLTIYSLPSRGLLFRKRVQSLLTAKKATSSLLRSALSVCKQQTMQCEEVQLHQCISSTPQGRPQQMMQLEFGWHVHASMHVQGS